MTRSANHRPRTHAATGPRRRSAVAVALVALGAGGFLAACSSTSSVQAGGGSTVPRTSRPGSSTPGSSAPGSTVPRTSSPASSTPGRSVPGTTMPPSGPGAAVPEVLSKEKLEGRTFHATSVSEGGAPRQLVPGTKVVLGFAQDKVSMGAGCNGTNASYRIDGATLVLTGEGISTLIGCAPEVEAQDAWAVQLLGARPTLVLAGDHLTFTSGATVIEFLDRKAAEPDKPLVGTHWVVDTAMSGDGTAGSAAHAAGGDTDWLEFAGGGTVRVHTGCNDSTARYAVAGDEVTFSEVLGPAIVNPCAPDAAFYEQAVQSTLAAGTVSLKIDSNRLTLTQQNGAGISATAA